MKSGILVTSSIAANAPIPGVTVYSGLCIIDYLFILILQFADYISNYKLNTVSIFLYYYFNPSTT